MLAIQIALIVLGVALTVAVLMQHGKSYGLSGTIAGGAETFFGKENGKKIDKVLSRATSIVGALFMVLSLAAFILQDGSVTPSSRNLGFIDLFGSSATEEHDHDHDASDVADTETGDSSATENE